MFKSASFLDNCLHLLKFTFECFAYVLICALPLIITLAIINMRSNAVWPFKDDFETRRESWQRLCKYFKHL